VIRKFIISLLISAILIESSIAEPILYATIRPGKWNAGSILLTNSRSDGACEQFPISSYTFYPVDGHDLKYDNQIPMKDRVENLYNFVLRPYAELKLFSHNPKTGLTRFRLILSGNFLAYQGWTDGVMLATGGTHLTGGFLKLDNGDNPEFIIEGKMKVINGNAHWTSFRKNPYYDIKVETFFNCRFRVKLNLLHDIPVMITR